MILYVLRRCLYTIPVLVLSSFLSFVFVSFAGDPSATLRANPRFSLTTLHHLRHQYHLDQPVVIRYFHWVHDVFTQKLGDSLITGQPIWPDISRTFLHTLQLITLSETLAIAIGLAIGIYSAVRQYSAGDYFFTAFSFVGFALPTFWLALLLQTLFVDVYLKWHVRIFYTSGLSSHGGGAWSLDRLQHLALPVVTLCIISLGLYSRFTRASMLDVMSADYVRTARGKGIPEWRVILGHVLRNALIPVVTVAALNVGGLLGGAIVTETVFSLDGIGFYFVNKLGQLDLYAVMGYLLVTSVLVVALNLVADVLYGWLDPRVRLD